MDEKHDKYVLNTPQEYVNTVVTLKKNNEFEAANVLVLEGLEKFPKEAALYLEYGDIAVRQKNWQEAAKRWTQMREQCPQKPHGYFRGVGVLKEQGNFTIADALALEGMEKFQNEPELYKQYADIAVRQKNWPEAAKRWALMREKCPDRPTGYAGGSRVLKEQRDFATADALVIEGLKKFPKEANLYIEYGDIAVRQKNWPEAAKRWTQMREQCPQKPHGYFRGVGALKEQGNFTIADALALEGMEKFPNEPELYKQYADIAVRQKNWPEAAKRWALMREKCPDRPTGYIGGSRALKEEGKFADADVLVLEGVEKFPKEFELYVIYGNIVKYQRSSDETIKYLASKIDIFLSKQQWSSLLVCYSNIVKMSLICDYRNIYMMRKCFVQLGFSKSDIQKVTEICWLEEGNYVEKIKKGLFTSKIENLSALFKKVIQPFLTNANAIMLWEESFDILLESIKYNTLPELENDIVTNKIANDKNFIIVSGMGWSGSGALLCYLSEFDEIKCIHEESQIFEVGLLKIVNNIDSKEKFISSCIDFVFCNLLGVFPYQSFIDIKAARLAMIELTSNQLEYAKRAYIIIKQLAFLICHYEQLEKSKLLKSIGNAIINFYACQTEKNIILLDNVIHIYNIRLINYIDGVHFFCCVREPRSHYVALKNEDPGFNRTLQSYVVWYRNQINRLNKEINSISNNLSHVYKIRFESFVSSEDYRRNEVLNKINPNLTHTKKYSRFKPWESLFNVFNYIQHEQYEEIEFIHNKLSEYCIDIDRHNIMDILYDCISENIRMQKIIDKKVDKRTESNLGLRRWNKSTDIS